MAKKKDAPADKKGTTALPGHEILLSSTALAGIAAEPFSKFVGEIDLNEYLTGIHKEVEKVKAGDMKPIEAMLYGQAMALNTMFTSLTRRAYSQEYLNQFQAYMALGLKAQAQCRAALEALAEVKNPRPVTFVKQANVAQQQQVNNGPPPASRTEKNGILKNELLEERHGDRVELGAQGEAGSSNPALEALGAVQRA